MIVTPKGVASMGAYKGTGVSRSMTCRRGESGTRVDVVMVSRIV